MRLFQVGRQSHTANEQPMPVFNEPGILGGDVNTCLYKYVRVQFESIRILGD